MDKTERRRNLKAFREGDVALLISTDLASRGLDVEHVGRVINYHMPQQMENYLHRVGRTARAGRPGLVVNFVTERDATLVNKLDAVRSSPKAALKSAPSKPNR
jgi:superfamily II DNA/RNA helicase